MLKKSDLAKQFELLTKQEIKNYNDTVLATNIALEKIRQNFEELNKKTLQSFYLNDGKFIAQDIALNRLKDIFDQSCCVLSRKTNDLFKQVEDYQKSSNSLIQEVKSNYLEKTEFKTSEKNILFYLSDLLYQINMMKESFQQELSKISKNLDCKFKNFRDEILNSPSEISLVKTQLEDKITSHTVDVAGILRELRIYKHDNMVTQKKIENIYTLIERLKKTGGDS